MSLFESVLERIKAIPQHHAERRLTKEVMAEYADDPTVQFEQFKPHDENAPHGINQPEEMAVTSADPVAD